jgi:Spy/CpxP family protein refolding chaperone
MRRTGALGGLTILVLAFSAVTAGAQNAAAPPRQRLRQNLATLRLLRLTQALDLSEEQAARIFPTVNKLEKEKAGLQIAMSADIRDLRRLLAESPAKEDDIAANVRKIKDAQQVVKQKDAELDAFLENNLTTVQKAKYVIFEIEFYRLLEQTLQGMRGMRGTMPPAPVKK